MVAIVRVVPPEEADLPRLRAACDELCAELAEREHALADLRAHLLSFEGRYIRQVGKLYHQLDHWERMRRELHELSGTEEDDDDDVPSALYTPPSQRMDLRLLFRELARRVHPDHATDDLDAQRRTTLMAQANEAFARRDAATLERMLRGFDVRLHPTAKEECERLGRLLPQLREDIRNVHHGLEELRTSQLADLERRTVEAARDGRDLLAEMARRVQALISLAMRNYELDLDRIRRPARQPGLSSKMHAG